ncbi:MAG: Clp protease N-terminal domain-containing protein, partial [Pseudomonadota bacterium]
MAFSLQDLLTSFGPTDALAATLRRAQGYARDQQHRLLTLEHLLLALSEDPDATIVLSACKIELARLQTDVSGYLGRLEDRVDAAHAEAGYEPALSDDLLRIFKVAHAAAQQKQRAPSGGLVLAAIVGDGRSPAANMLRAQGLSFEEAVQALQAANAQLRAAQSLPAPTPEASSAPTNNVSAAPISQPATQPVSQPTRQEHAFSPASSPSPAPMTPAPTATSQTAIGPTQGQLALPAMRTAAPRPVFEPAPVRAPLPDAAPTPSSAPGPQEIPDRRLDGATEQPAIEQAAEQLPATVPANASERSSTPIKTPAFLHPPMVN